MKRDTYGKLCRQANSFHFYNQGVWTNQQCSIFNKAIKKYGKNWHKIALELKTRTLRQICSHAQKQSIKQNINKGLIEKNNKDKINTRLRLGTKKIYNHKRKTVIQRQKHLKNVRQRSSKKIIKKNEKNKGVKERMTRKVPLILKSLQLKSQKQDKCLESIVQSQNNSNQAKLRDQESEQQQQYGSCKIETKKQHNNISFTNLRQQNPLVLSSFQRFRPIQKAQKKKQQQNGLNCRNMQQTKNSLNLDYSETSSLPTLHNKLQTQNNCLKKFPPKEPKITMKKMTKKILKSLKDSKKKYCKNKMKNNQLEVILQQIDQNSVQDNKPKAMELKKPSLISSPAVIPNMIDKQGLRLIERTFSWNLYNFFQNQDAKAKSIIQV